MKKKANDTSSRSVFGNGCTVRKDVHRFNKISQLIFLQFSHLPKRWKRKDRGCEVPDTGVSRSADHNVRIQISPSYLVVNKNQKAYFRHFTLNEIRGVILNANIKMLKW